MNLISDGWTTDRRASTISLMNEVAPIIGSTVKVCVTHIRKVDDFYVHIPEISAQFDPASLNELKNQMNLPEMAKLYKPSAEKPSNYFQMFSILFDLIGTCMELKGKSF